eukprot:g4467.t1
MTAIFAFMEKQTIEAYLGMLKQTLGDSVDESDGGLNAAIKELEAEFSEEGFDFISSTEDNEIRIKKVQEPQKMKDQEKLEENFQPPQRPVKCDRFSMNMGYGAYNPDRMISLENLKEDYVKAQELISWAVTNDKCEVVWETIVKAFELLGFDRGSCLMFQISDTIQLHESNEGEVIKSHSDTWEKVNEQDMIEKDLAIPAEYQQEIVQQDREDLSLKSDGL